MRDGANRNSPVWNRVNIPGGNGQRAPARVSLIPHDGPGEERAWLRGASTGYQRSWPATPTKNGSPPANCARRAARRGRRSGCNCKNRFKRNHFFGGAREGRRCRCPLSHGGGDGGALGGAGPARVGGAIRAAGRAPRLPRRLRRDPDLREALRRADLPGRRSVLGPRVAREGRGSPRESLAETHGKPHVTIAGERNTWR
jgi:hypothetical protein